MPKVSVVMSTYDDAEYLVESIDSVLAQEFKDFEFVIINDGSPDPRSRKILSNYEKRDDRIRIINKKNEGLTKALIDGCDAANGKYIARIDVGDVMAPNRLGKQQQVLEEYPNCAFVSCYTEFYGPKWEYLWISQGKPENNGPVFIISPIPEDGVVGDIPHHSSVMSRKTAYESVGGYRMQFYFGQDWDLWYRLADVGTYFVVPEVLYRVRIFPESISMLNKYRQDAVAECSKGAFLARCRNEDEQPWLDKAASIRPDNLTTPKNKNQYCNTEPGLYFIGEALRRNGDRRCRPYFLAAIRQNPLRTRSYIRLFQSLI